MVPRDTRGNKDRRKAKDVTERFAVCLHLLTLTLKGWCWTPPSTVLQPRHFRAGSLSKYRQRRAQPWRDQHCTVLRKQHQQRYQPLPGPEHCLPKSPPHSLAIAVAQDVFLTCLALALITPHPEGYPRQCRQTLAVRCRPPFCLLRRHFSGVVTEPQTQFSQQIHFPFILLRHLDR